MSKAFYSLCQHLGQQLGRYGFFLLRILALRAGVNAQVHQRLYPKQQAIKPSSQFCGLK